MATRTMVPQGLDPVMTQFLDDLARRATSLEASLNTASGQISTNAERIEVAAQPIAAQSDVAAGLLTTPTVEELKAAYESLETAFNQLLAAMRAADKMES